MLLCAHLLYVHFTLFLLYMFPKATKSEEGWIWLAKP